MPLAKANCPDGNKTRRRPNVLSFYKNICIDPEWIDKTLSGSNSVFDHRFFNECRRAENQVGALQFAIHAAEHPLGNGNLFARIPDVAFPLPIAIEARGMAVWAV